MRTIWGPNMERAIQEFRERTGRNPGPMARTEFSREMDALCGTPKQGHNHPEVAAANWLRALGIEPPAPRHGDPHPPPC